MRSSPLPAAATADDGERPVAAGTTTPAWLWAAGALPALLLAALLGLAVTGATTPGLVDAGALVRWGVPLTSALGDAGFAVTIGAFTLCAVVLHQENRAWSLAAAIGSAAAVTWALAQVAFLVLTYGQAAGGLGGATFGAQLWQFVTELELGRFLLWAALLAAAVALVAVAVTGYRSAAVAVVAALIALVPLAETNHGSGSTDHTLAVSSWWLHTAGVAVWAGALVALCAVGGRLGAHLPGATERYSRLAVWAFAATALGGVAAGWLRVSSLSELLTHPYGQLLLAKTCLTVALGAAGWWHRRATIPAIAAHAGSTDPAGRGRAFWRLAGVETLLMAAAAGLGVALGSSAPPVPEQQIPDTSPTFFLSGYPVPSYPSALAYLTEWRFEPVLAFATAAAVLVYLRWARRLRLRGDSWSAVRTASWVAGWLLFAWITQGGPTVYGSILFSAHMMMHMLLAMVVPILLTIGAPVTLAARALPRRNDGTRGPREWVLGIVHSRYASFLAHPIVAAINFAGSMILFYYTGLFELALTTHVGHLLMVAHFTAAGYLFANALIGADPGPTRPSYPLRLMLLLATMAFHAFFGVALTQQSTLLAADYFGWLGLPWNVDALADQTRGGAFAWGIGELPTLALAIGVAVMWAKEDTRTARRQDRAADRDEDAELRAYNEMLRRRAESGNRPRP